MTTHYRIPPSLPAEVSRQVATRRDVRPDKIPYLWGFLLSTDQACSPAEVRAATFAGTFPDTLAEVDRAALGAWIDSAACSASVSAIRARFLGDCPARSTDLCLLPALPAQAAVALRGIERLRLPCVRAL